MALEEEQAGTVEEVRSALECLRGSPDLASLDEDTLDALSTAAVEFSLPAGALLFEAGSACEGVYLLVSGRLSVESPADGQRLAEIERGELVGDAGWLLKAPRGATVVALRDSELILIPSANLDDAAAGSSALGLALARLSARRLLRGNKPQKTRRRARVFVIVPNNEEVDTADLATRLVAELGRDASVELVWEVRASLHSLAWFNGIEERNDHVVYVADPADTAWTRQCCRQADVILLAARASADRLPWPPSIADATLRGARVELALLHEATFAAGAAARWLDSMPAIAHHHVQDAEDLGRLARLLSQRGVGLVLSGGGARGFAHLGVIRALREARVPIDFVGGASIGAIIAAGVAMGWSDEEMQSRYRHGFVDSNPVNDYTFPWVALTRGRKVTRLLQREYGDASIEDLKIPFFCVSANLTTGRAYEHRSGSVALALRASVSIPGVMPPVFQGGQMLVDGAAINNLPVDLMQHHAPGLVIGCDVGADRANGASQGTNIFQVLMCAGMLGSASSAAAQRKLADVLLKPVLTNVDLLDWQAFDRAIEAGYVHACHALDALPDLPRLAAPARAASAGRGATSLDAELERRLAAGRPAATRPAG